MPLRVISFCYYLTDVSCSWRGRDFDAHDFVKASKGHPPNGYAQIPILGKIHRIDNTNLNLSADLFAELVGEYLQKNPLGSPLRLIPVPNSGSVAPDSAPQTAALAHAIAKKLRNGATVVDCLRWKIRLPSASAAGGTRDSRQLYQNLVHTAPIGNGPYILVDDVLTSGGHLSACAAYLRGKGATVTEAFCVGRTTQAQPNRPFDTIEDMLEDYEP